MTNKITNIAATPAPLDLNDADRQSKALALCEGVVEMAVRALRNNGIDVSIPALRKGAGQVNVCGEDSRERRTHKVIGGVETGRHEEKYASIIVSEHLMPSGVLCVTYLLHAVAAIAGMKAKGKSDMRSYSRRNKVFAESLAVLGLDFGDDDYKGARGGVCDVSMSAATRNKYQRKIDALNAINVSSMPADETAKRESKRSTKITVDFGDIEKLDAFLAILEAPTNEKTGDLEKTIGADWMLGQAQMLLESDSSPLAVVNG